MKIAPYALFTSLVASADATSLREVSQKAEGNAAADTVAERAAAESEAAAGVDAEGRELQTGCWNNPNVPLQWHPQYSAGWANGYCRETVDCNSPGYSTQLECCKGSYSGQVSGYCLSQLPSPPTTSPTGTGGLDVFYPDYSTSWSDAYCINDGPLPSGRPTYSTMLECCKGAYGGQTSGKCLSMLPSPPTMSPTGTGGLDVFYPDYSTSWSDAYCINDGPLPSGRPTYSTMLECCKAAYGGQLSGKCLSMLPSPPTGSPTSSEYEADFWYPRYDEDWSNSGCSNSLPLPYTNIGDRPNYPTQLACCKAAYGGQASGKCLSELPSAPTTSPTGTEGYDFYYPDYETPWSEATCVNARPLPFAPGGRPTYDTMLDCCKGAYGGQVSGACLAALPSPPTSSPTSSGGLDLWYPSYDTWATGHCKNDGPLPSGRPTYASAESCCAGAYAAQLNHHCFCQIDPCHSCECSGAGSASEDATNCPALSCE